MTRTLARSLSAPLLLALATTAGAQEDPREQTYAAVVIGMSSYINLPDEVELDFARSDAATVATTLETLGKYDHVFLLADREATREEVRETIRTKVAQYTGPNDHLLVYFVGHGIGSDLGLPVLLAYDSTLENGHEDGFEIESFARDIATWTRAGSTLIVTDAIHKNQLDGIYFYGPAADQWPNVGPKTMIVSASESNAPGTDGMFGVIFADAMAGAADSNADTTITAKELSGYLSTRLTGSGQTPVIAGTFAEDMPVATGVVPGTTSAGTSPDQMAIYGEHDVYAAKFVFRDGATPKVECREAPITVCDNLCYVRNFKAGPCTLTAIEDGEEVRGVTLALVPGKYDCGMRPDGTLACTPPSMGNNNR